MKQEKQIIGNTATGKREPLYMQVSRMVKQKIRLGEYNEYLPSVRELSKFYNVSVTVIHRALCGLEEERLIKLHHGRRIEIISSRQDARSAAIFFGFIHPYSLDMVFSGNVLAHLEAAFSDKQNLVVIRSSHNDPAMERKVAENLVGNGIRGLMVWPEEKLRNGNFFKKLSEDIPVVVVDRTYPDVDLPYFGYDSYRVGGEICRYLVRKKKKKRILAVVDDLEISPYENIIRGLLTQAENYRHVKLDIKRFPVSQMICEVGKADFSLADKLVEKTDRILSEGCYDAVMCTQGEFIAYVIADTDLYDKYSNILYVIRDLNDCNIAGRKFNRLDMVRFRYDLTDIISKAAQELQKWILSKKVNARKSRLLRTFMVDDV
ncbi:GntR family transcriptional regulator [candidate division KSB1 bacterium]|nr:GntR family transcriptional regulator [candidate division KSB1 bacterium]